MDPLHNHGNRLQ